MNKNTMQAILKAMKKQKGTLQVLLGVIRRIKKKFTKTNEIYKIVRITGGYDNILGVCFTQKDNEPLEIIEWDLKNTETIKTSRSEIQSQVISGLRLVNQDLNTNYRVSKTYYVSIDNPSNSVYEFLIQELIKHLHSDQVFEEVLG